MKNSSTLLAVFATFLFSCGIPSFGAEPIGLINGKDLKGWVGTKNQDPASWKAYENFIEVVPGTGDIQTEQVFNDFELHAEFWIPYLPEKTGQDRGNSGIFLRGRYEIQVLDTWENETYPDGICGALYKILTPKFNASLPPETWQTYDIRFIAPKVETDGKILEPGELTVILNGNLIIDRGHFEHPTGSAKKMKQGVPGPIRLQDHGSPVRFRNFFLKPLN